MAEKKDKLPGWDLSDLYKGMDDPAIEKAVEILAEGKAFPEAPQETENEKD